MAGSNCIPCGGRQAHAAGTKFVIHFADKSKSAEYPDETSARVALGRSGKTGVVKPA